MLQNDQYDSSVQSEIATLKRKFSESEQANKELLIEKNEYENKYDQILKKYNELENVNKVLYLEKEKYKFLHSMAEEQLNCKIQFNEPNQKLFSEEATKRLEIENHSLIKINRKLARKQLKLESENPLTNKKRYSKKKLSNNTAPQSVQRNVINLDLNSSDPKLGLMQPTYKKQ